MTKVYIIGAGPGAYHFETILGKAKIEECQVLIGENRILSGFQTEGKVLYPIAGAVEVEKRIRMHVADGPIGVVVSGDSGFYSLTKSLIPLIHDLSVQIIPGISSIQLMAAELGISWEDAALHSVHGRRQPVLAAVAHHEKTFILLDHEQNPKTLCQEFIDAGFENLKIAVGERLSYSDQRILQGLPRDFLKDSFSDLSVMLVVNDSPLNPSFYTPGMEDDRFIRGEVPMTKGEIRALSLSKLQIKPGDVLYDIGAGTGSVSVEMSFSAPEGRVYAIEKNPKGIELLDQNKKRFRRYNLEIIPGYAPEALSDLPPPDRVFIGGSSGRLSEIIQAVYQKNREARVVINAITVETLAEAISYYKERREYQMEILSVSIAHGEKIGNSHLMKGQNPIYILTAKKNEEEN